MGKYNKTKVELRSELEALQARVRGLEEASARVSSATEKLLEAEAELDRRQAEISALLNSFSAIMQYRTFEGAARSIFRRVVETRLPHFAFEKPFVYADHPERGVTYWDWSLQPVKDATCKVRGVILGLVDVTERKRAQLALHASEAKYSTLVENSLTGISINLDGRLVFVNDRFAEIFGYSRDELMGMEVWRLVHPEDRALVEDMRRKRLRGEPVPAEYETRGLTKRGETVWVARRNTVIDYQGQPAVLGNLADVTKRREIEEALRHSERELRHLSAQLLSTQETERGRVARDLHDGIGQWLSAIKFRVEDVLQHVRRGASEEGFQLLEQVIPLIRKAIDEVTVKEEEIPEALKVVIYRILQEALNNVAKHSEAGLVRIRLRKRRGEIELSVRDNGKGFEPARVPSHETGKAGFALASMRERTELSGGSLLLESGKGRGTLIRALWPAR